jgi:hypothetical protein
MEPEATETGVGEPEPVVTETMAEIYAAQGHRQEAIEVYRTLLARTPGDIRLQDKLARLEGRQVSAPSPAAAAPFATHVPAPAPAAAARTFVAAPESGASVTSLLQRVLGSRLGGGNGNPTAASEYAIPEPPAALPPPVPTPAPQAVPEVASTLDRVFDAEAGSERDFRPAGEPTRPAEDRLSLSSVFGDESAASPLDEPEPAPRTSGPVRKPMSASSFDAFFSAPASEPSPPTGGERTSGPTEGAPQGDDLDQFQGWLKGLKR